MMGRNQVKALISIIVLPSSFLIASSSSSFSSSSSSSSSSFLPIRIFLLLFFVALYLLLFSLSFSFFIFSLSLSPVVKLCIAVITACIMRSSCSVCNSYPPIALRRRCHFRSCCHFHRVRACVRVCLCLSVCLSVIISLCSGLFFMYGDAVYWFCGCSFFCLIWMFQHDCLDTYCF